MNIDNFYCCYSTRQQKFLRDVKGLAPILEAKNIYTDKVFYLYFKNIELDKALSEWSIRKENGVRTI